MHRVTIFERPVVDKVEIIKAFAKSLGISDVDIKIARIMEENPEINEEAAIGKLIRQKLVVRENNKEYRAIAEDELVDYPQSGVGNHASSEWWEDSCCEGKDMNLFSLFENLKSEPYIC